MRKQPITVRLPKNIVNALTTKAEEETKRTGKTVTKSDFLREIVSDWARDLDTRNETEDFAIQESCTLDIDMEQLAQDFIGGSSINESSKKLSNWMQNIVEKRSIGRKLLSVDELPQGALARYDKKNKDVHITSRRQALPDTITEGKDVVIPTFEIACAPHVGLEDIFQQRKKIIEKELIKGAYALCQEETRNVIYLLEYAASCCNNEKVVRGLTWEHIINAMSRLNGEPGTVVVSLNNYLLLKDIVETDTKANKYCDLVLDDEELDEILSISSEIKPVGKIKKSNIFISDIVNNKIMFVTKSPGTMPIREKGTIIFNTDPKQLQFSFVFYESIGMIVYDGCCSTIEIKR